MKFVSESHDRARLMGGSLKLRCAGNEKATTLIRGDVTSDGNGTLLAPQECDLLRNRP